MRLSPAQAAKLARLARGESMPRGQVPPALLKPLQTVGAVRLERSGSSYLVRGDPARIAAFAAETYGVQDLVRYATAAPDQRPRELLAEIAGDTKALRTNPLEGILIRARAGDCTLGGDPLLTPVGSAALVTLSDLPRLQLRVSCLIGIENAACLTRFEQALRHFPQLAGVHHCLVLRWHWGAAWRSWLAGWSGQFWYFPDYDPAGLRIFAHEILSHRPDARLLVPANLSELLAERGNRRLYLEQEAFAVPQTDADITAVQTQLRTARKTLEQESLLY